MSDLLASGAGGATPRHPDLRRALVTEASPDGESVRVLVEYLRLVRPRDEGAIQAEAEPDTRGLEARGLPGVRVGDEVLVDLRQLPVIRLSFLYFGNPLLLGALAALGVGPMMQALGAVPAVVLFLQVLAGAGGLVLGLAYAEWYRRGLEAAGFGTPVVTAVMPRLVDAGDDPEDPRDAFLLSRFPLVSPPRDEDWRFASQELERVVGVRSVQLLEDRVEIVYHGRHLRESHLLELLLTFAVAVELDRELVD